MMPAEQTVVAGSEESTAVLVPESSSGKDEGPAVVLQGLNKSFGSQVVLDGINLTVKSGETLAILGRSGTGKSVLLKLIVGLQKPDSGSICVHEQEITGLDLRELNKVRKKNGFLISKRGPV